MKTIQELQQIVNNGDCAQDELNKIAKDIFYTYTKELGRLFEELDENPNFSIDNRRELSNILGYNFDSFSLGKNLTLKGRETFRGETDYEYEELPLDIFINDPIERTKRVLAFAKMKADNVRARLKNEAEEEEKQAKQNYEYLKERFENAK